MTSYIWKGEPREETRQEYANQRLEVWQNFRAGMLMPFTFDELLSTFRYYGRKYDQGSRLFDLEGAA